VITSVNDKVELWGSGFHRITSVAVEVMSSYYEAAAVKLMACDIPIPAAA
jgi:hypothetical protein